MTRKTFQLLQRGRAWKDYVEQTLASASTELSRLRHAVADAQEGELARRNQDAEIQAALSDLSTKLDRLALRQNLLMQHERLEFEKTALPALLKRVPEGVALDHRYRVLLSRRDATLVILLLAENDPLLDSLGGIDPHSMIGGILDGSLCEAIAILPDGVGGHIKHRCDEFLAAIIEKLPGALDWAEAHQPSRDPQKPAPDYFTRLEQILEDLERLDFHALGCLSGDRQMSNAPFDEPAFLPPLVPAQPKRRSVLFTHHSYYNFYYLAEALRARGWDALCVSVESPDSPNSKFYHGEDLNIFDPDPILHKRKIQSFWKDNADRFGMTHSYGTGILSLFSSNHASPSHTTSYPWDVLEAKRRGVLIGYTHSGCLDGVSQTSFREWSPSMCANCPWESTPVICSDTRNLEWGRKLTSIVDLFCTETDPPLDFKASKKAFRAPLTFAMSPEYWSPNLEIPEKFDRKTSADEIVVYHAMGNYRLRSREGRNVKGTGAVVMAVQQLQSEGIRIRLDFVENIPTRDNRYIQAQADIIVDQLNYGRYGALAREGMMLGKPVVGRVNKMDGPGSLATRCILDTPIVNADETTILEVLRDLALDRDRRQAIGRASREHAIQWWSGDRLAERYERVHDYLREHGSPPPEDEVP